MTQPEPALPTPVSPVLGWARLMRISNLPTAIANVLLGFLIANGSWSPGLQLAMLIIGSALLYSAGMILNDVFDIEQDRLHRPSRPLPSGAISVATARTVGIAFVVIAIGLGFAVGVKSGIVAALLGGAVFLYDWILKKTLIAPFAMGSCRALNVLLGASFLSTPASEQILGFPTMAVWVAVSIGIAIAGITWIARNEASAEDQPTATVQSSLVFGTLLLVAGLAGLAFTGMAPGVPAAQGFSQLFPFLILLVSITILRHAMIAIWTCSSREIQGTVIAYLRSLIIFDASVCLLAAPGQIHYALIVLSLLIPCLVLSRWIKQT